MFNLCNSQDEIEKYLDEVCALLPSSISGTCDTIVKTYTPAIIQLLLTEKPEDVCAKLGLCSSIPGRTEDRLHNWDLSHY